MLESAPLSASDDNPLEGLDEPQTEHYEALGLHEPLRPNAMPGDPPPEASPEEATHLAGPGHPAYEELHAQEDVTGNEEPDEPSLQTLAKPFDALREALASEAPLSTNDRPARTDRGSLESLDQSTRLGDLAGELSEALHATGALGDGEDTGKEAYEQALASPPDTVPPEAAFELPSPLEESGDLSNATVDADDDPELDALIGFHDKLPPEASLPKGKIKPARERNRVNTRPLPDPSRPAGKPPEKPQPAALNSILQANTQRRPRISRSLFEAKDRISEISTSKLYLASGSLLLIILGLAIWLSGRLGASDSDPGAPPPNVGVIQVLEAEGQGPMPIELPIPEGFGRLRLHCPKRYDLTADDQKVVEASQEAQIELKAGLHTIVFWEGQTALRSLKIDLKAGQSQALPCP